MCIMYSFIFKSIGYVLCIVLCEALARVPPLLSNRKLLTEDSSYLGGLPRLNMQLVQKKLVKCSN